MATVLNISSELILFFRSCLSIIKVSGIAYSWTCNNRTLAALQSLQRMAHLGNQSTHWMCFQEAHDGSILSPKMHLKPGYEYQNIRHSNTWWSCLRYSAWWQGFIWYGFVFILAGFAHFSYTRWQESGIELKSYPKGCFQSHKYFILRSHCQFLIFTVIKHSILKRKLQWSFELDGFKAMNQGQSWYKAHPEWHRATESMNIISTINQKPLPLDHWGIWSLCYKIWIWHLHWLIQSQLSPVSGLTNILSSHYHAVPQRPVKKKKLQSVCHLEKSL